MKNLSRTDRRTDGRTFWRSSSAEVENRKLGTKNSQISHKREKIWESTGPFVIDMVCRFIKWIFSTTCTTHAFLPPKFRGGGEVRHSKIPLQGGSTEPSYFRGVGFQGGFQYVGGGFDNITWRNIHFFFSLWLGKFSAFLMCFPCISKQLLFC